ncbi:hypothetical protein UlMin_030349 [Ulmus minor]
MESDLQHHLPQPQPQMNSGLVRYRSAPSSYFADVLDREFCQQFFNRPSSPETERIFARFMNSEADDSASQKITTQPEQQTQFPAKPIGNEAPVLQQQPQPPPPQPQQQTNINSYSSSSQSFYQSTAKPPLIPSQGLASGNEGSYSSMGMNRFPPMRTGGANSSNLIRTSSSPAGLFASISIDNNGFVETRGMGSYGGANARTNEEAASYSPPNRLKNFSPAPPPAVGIMSPIIEIDDKSLVATLQDSGGGFGEEGDSNYVPNFPTSSWDDSAMMSDNITGLKRHRDDDSKPFTGLNSSKTQNLELGTRPPMLAHHLSLPKTASEMAVIEKFLQYQDSVPCKIRAKRGCATHPRSIAERVRRTKISERMRKLQELVPNMEKQTNTSDMLDLAVEYIKDLQTQVHKLADIRAKCTCSANQQQ